MPPARRLSIIIPALNEERCLGETLESLASMRTEGHECLVVDGGSSDATREIAEPLCDRVLITSPGRARQMNAGAAAASGDILVFLHADTQLPLGATKAIIAAMEPEQARGWGRFDIRLTGAHPLLRMVEALISLRSRLNGIATGDQAIFVRRQLFEEVGGFREIPLMEDVALARALLQHGRPHCLRQQVRSSSRRWEDKGIWRTIFLMWRLRWAYAHGADPHDLAKLYDPPNRCPSP